MDADKLINMRRTMRDVESLRKQPLSSELRLVFNSFRDLCGLICASPKRIPVFKTTYAFYSDNIESEGGQEHVVNVDYATAEKFVYDQISKAREGASPVSSSALKRITFLVGGIGCGKSTFVNYVISVFHRVFVTQSVVCIKLDLAMEYKDEAFLYLFAKKTLRILKDKYFARKQKMRWKENFDAIKLMHYIGSLRLPEGDAEKMKEYARSYFGIQEVMGSTSSAAQCFADSKRDMVIFFDIVVEYVKSCAGHTFLFVIDGLDNYTRDDNNQDSFSRRCSDFFGFALERKMRGEALVVALRPESYAELKRQARRKGVFPGTESAHGISSLYIKSPGGTEIIDKKISSLLLLKKRKNLSRRECDIYDDIERNYNKISEFLMRALCSSVYLDGRVKVESKLALEDIFGSDSRAFVRACLLILFEAARMLEALACETYGVASWENIKKLLAHDVNGVKRKILRRIRTTAIHALMTNEYMISLSRYEYAAGCTKIVAGGEFFAGGTLIPNLIYVCDKFSAKEIFIKLRVLQFLIYNEEMKLSCTSLGEVSSLLSEIFGYDASHIAIEWRMLYATRCITREGCPAGERADEVLAINDNDDPSMCCAIENDDLFAVTTLGKSIVNSLIRNIAYWRGVTDHLAVPSHLLNYFSTPLFVHDNNVGSYNANKRKRINCLIEFLKDIDMQEKDMAAHYSGNCDHPFRGKEVFFMSSLMK